MFIKVLFFVVAVQASNLRGLGSVANRTTRGDDARSLSTSLYDDGGIFCATELHSCSIADKFDSSQWDGAQARFGSQDTGYSNWQYIKDIRDSDMSHGTFMCSGYHFGMDPAPYKVKDCYVRAGPTALEVIANNGVEQCTQEGKDEYCYCPGGEVRYGRLGWDEYNIYNDRLSEWRSTELFDQGDKKSVLCAMSTWGYDPAHHYSKACYCRLPPTAPTPAPTPLPSWISFRGKWVQSGSTVITRSVSDEVCNSHTTESSFESSLGQSLGVEIRKGAEVSVGFATASAEVGIAFGFESAQTWYDSVTDTISGCSSTTDEESCAYGETCGSGDQIWQWVTEGTLSDGTVGTVQTCRYVCVPTNNNKIDLQPQCPYDDCDFTRGCECCRHNEWAVESERDNVPVCEPRCWEDGLTYSECADTVSQGVCHGSGESSCVESECSGCTDETPTPAPTRFPTSSPTVANSQNHEGTISVAGGKSSGNTYLSTGATGSYVDLYSHDDGSGRQQWVVSLVAGTSDTYTIQVAGGKSSGNTYLSTGTTGNGVDLYSHDDASGRQQWRIPNLTTSRM